MDRNGYHALRDGSKYTTTTTNNNNNYGTVYGDDDTRSVIYAAEDHQPEGYIRIRTSYSISLEEEEERRRQWKYQ